MSVRLRLLRVGLLILGLLCGLAVLPSAALADGDPGSDVLLAQNLFAGADASLSVAQQSRLGQLLDETSAAGAPIRVAIIAKRDDLGTVTALWGSPQEYAGYLGTELSLAYTGRLLVVMPTGYGVLDFSKDGKDTPTALARPLSRLRAPGAAGASLVGGAVAAVYALEAAAGVSKADLAHEKGASSVLSSSAAPRFKQTTTGAHDTTPAIVFGLVVVLLLIAYVCSRRGWKPKLRAGWRGKVTGALRPARLRPIVLLPTALLVIVIAALVINQAHGGNASGSDLANNPNLDPGTQLTPRAAPNFTLTDETGKQISLKQYRGKVVILSFVDAECQTLCPLTTQAMLYAKRSLGAAGKKVQLLGVDANWKSTQVDDVLNYTELHGLTGQWHFLTGSLKQLQDVWSAYGVNEKKYLDAESNEIDHVAATFIIAPDGQLRTTYLTQPSYSAVRQFAQVMAREASKLLPSHPEVDTDYSYSEVSGISPAQSTTLPKVGGGSVKLGPGQAHLYLFFATWDAQTTPIAAELSELKKYRRYAKSQGLPALTAIDEGSVEPSAAALPAFLKTVPSALSYPVAIDRTGQVADGYEVEGDPWFVLTSPAGEIRWYQEVYTSGWPTLTELEGEVKDALSKTPKAAKGLSAQLKQLNGSPTPLASLHAQAARLLTGGSTALTDRISKLHGYPIVVNIWGSWCVPCQKEFPLFQDASALYGKKVAFLGADYNDQPGNASAFLNSHPVSYPSYPASSSSLDALITGGLEGTPTTLFISRTGKVLYIHIGQYESQGSLDADIQDYALGAAN